MISFHLSPQTGKSNGCDCCELTSPEGEVSYDCVQRRTVFTPRELQILARIRELGQRARMLKRALRDAGVSGGPEGSIRADLLTELEALREERKRAESERIDARAERMRLLGHE